MSKENAKPVMASKEDFNVAAPSFREGIIYGKDPAGDYASKDDERLIEEARKKRDQSAQTAPK